MAGSAGHLPLDPSFVVSWPTRDTETEIAFKLLSAPMKPAFAGPALTKGPWRRPQIDRPAPKTRPLTAQPDLAVETKLRYPGLSYRL